MKKRHTPLGETSMVTASFTRKGHSSNTWAFTHDYPEAAERPDQTRIIAHAHGVVERCENKEVNENKKKQNDSPQMRHRFHNRRLRSNLQLVVCSMTPTTVAFFRPTYLPAIFRRSPAVPIRRGYNWVSDDRKRPILLVPSTGEGS